MSLKTLIAAAAADGLIYRGGFVVSDEDAISNLNAATPAAAIALFGNAGSSIWQSFSASAEYADGAADPLNRWSVRLGKRLAAQVGGQALFPFGGPPYQPFLQWAKKAESLSASKIGMLIHPEYGLWHAYRFAVALPPSAIANAQDKRCLTALEAINPCEKCLSQACLKSCPVGAFSAGHYALKTCFDYLDNTPAAPCHRHGCQARTACPEGQNFLYEAEHAAFHMRQFVSALQPRYQAQ